MDGKRNWLWAILLAPVASWMWFRGLFEKQPTPPEHFSRWSESKMADAMDSTLEHGND